MINKIKNSVLNRKFLSIIFMLIYIISFMYSVSAVQSPDIITNKVYDIDSKSAILEGEITSVGGYNSTAVYFEYRKGNDGTFIETDKLNKSAEDVFRKTIDNLNSSTYYEYKAIIEYNGDRKEGSLQSFNTEPRESLFTVDFSETSNIIFLIIISLLAVFLFLIGYSIYTSAIVTILGFIFLNSGMNAILSIFVVGVGVAIAFIGGNEE